MSVVPLTPSYTYYFIQSQLNGYVVDVKGADGNNGATLQMIPMKDVSDADNQLWYFSDAGSGYYYIQSKMNDLVMDVKGGKPNPGTPIISHIRNNGPNQRWKLRQDGSVVFIESALGNSLVMDIKGASTDKGAIVQVSTYHAIGNDNQEWKLVLAK